MRFNNYLNEESIIQKALALEEPDLDTEYTDEEVKSNLDILNQAIKKQESLSDNEASTAILKDLEDKKGKWEHWEEVVKSQGPNKAPEEIGMEELPPEGEEEPPEEEPEEKPKK